MKLAVLGAGLNVARMAHLPPSVIECAGLKAAAMEADTLKRFGSRSGITRYVMLLPLKVFASCDACAVYWVVISW